MHLQSKNVILVLAVFQEEEARIICNIPSFNLSPLQPKDLLIYMAMHYVQMGLFSVKSAYHIKNDLQALSKGGSSSPQEGCKSWKAVWNLDVSNAIKMFL
jgi:hypothetical protein